eukprot:2178749-Pleurochrysis_carterae.AAC.10
MRPCAADGYAFAAAEAGVTHTLHPQVMLYAGQEPSAVLPEPQILHYGLWCSVQLAGAPQQYVFNKLSYAGSHPGSFNPDNCDHYMPEPPDPHVLMQSGGMARGELGSALLCSEVGATVNAALCLFHRSGHAQCDGALARQRPCPEPSLDTLAEVQELSGAIGAAHGCSDADSRCADWAANGECETNAAFMLPVCARSCKAASCSREELQANGNGRAGHRSDNGGGRGDTSGGGNGGGGDGGGGGSFDGDVGGGSMDASASDANTPVGLDAADTNSGALSASPHRLRGKRSMHQQFTTRQQAAAAPLSELMSEDAHEFVATEERTKEPRPAVLDQFEHRLLEEEGDAHSTQISALEDDELTFSQEL